MPDPLTNLEIQDVLSSIRRLVSEDSRHRAERDHGRAAAPAGAGKLVLTEALRVPAAAEIASEPVAEPGQEASVAAAAEEDLLRQTVSGEGLYEADETVPAVAEAEAAAGGDWEDAGGEAGASLEDTIAELEAAVAGIGGEFEPDGSEVAQGTLADSALEEAFEDGFAVDEAAEAESDDLAQPVTSGELAQRDPAGAPQGSGPGAGDDPANAVEPPATAADATDGEPTDTGAVSRDTGDVLPADHFDLAGMSPAEAQEGKAIPAFVHSGRIRHAPGTVLPAGEPRPAGLRRLTLGAAQAVSDAPQTAAAPWDRGDDAPGLGPSGEAGAEPVVLDDAPGIASALSGDADLAGDAGDIATAGMAEDAEGPASIFGPGAEAVIDMDMLRDLVAEIIREELQGTLGERITRNVRMLVRREINRALETRGLED